MMSCFLLHASNGVHGDKDYCIAEFSAPPEKLQAFIDYGCGKYDCAAIQQNGPCFLPDNVQSHASYVLDLVYRQTGQCDLHIAYLTTFDNSFGNCHYP